MIELLRIQDLHISFSTPSGELQAVRGVSLSIFKGETLALVGESGCGKSVTAKSILRLNPSPPARTTAGSITLLDRDLTNLSEKEINQIRGNLVGMIFQDPTSSLNPSMRIGKQLTDGLRKHRKLSAAECREEALRLLDLVQIPDPAARIRQYPHQLSGGMSQRIMIAMALACQPQILIADEPTTALDVTTQAEILALLGSLKERLEMSTLFITHDLAVAANLADRIAIMYAGKIVEIGSVLSVFEAPAHPYTKALFESHPSINREPGKKLAFIPGSLPDLTVPVVGCAFAPRCAYCQERCRKEVPPCKDMGNGHEVHCWTTAVV